VTGTNRERASGSSRDSEAAPPDLAPPQPLLIAVRLMYAGAALTLAGAIADVIDIAVGGIAGLRRTYPHASAAHLHASLHTLITSIIFAGLIEAALWLFMARANRSGVPWARVFASVLFGINTVLLARGLLGASPVTGKAFTALIWLLGLAAAWLLWQRESSGYFRAPAAPRADAAPPASPPRSRPGRSSPTGPGTPSKSG
jgi:hypothetical protein